MRELSYNLTFNNTTISNTKEYKEALVWKAKGSNYSFNTKLKTIEEIPFEEEDNTQKKRMTEWRRN